MYVRRYLPRPAGFPWATDASRIHVYILYAVATVGGLEVGGGYMK